MSELLTAAQMRAIEQAAIESGKVTGLELMERAGRGVVDAIFEEWPELDQRGPAPAPPKYLNREEAAPRAVVLCGPGNNGGDGFVVARLLRERGWAVEVFLYGNAEKLPPDARRNYERWYELGAVDSAVKLIGWRGRCFDLVVDALFGTGLARALGEELVEIRRFLQMHPIGKVVAVDAVSGLDLDSGLSLTEAQGELFPQADLTVTFHKPKLGHFVGEAAQAQSKVVVVDIGIGRFDPELDQVELLDYNECDPLLDKGEVLDGHKFSHGHALILSGGFGKTGAARLAARGALRVGAGLVTLGVPGSAQIEVASQITALMMQRVEDGAGLSEILQDARVKSLCLGPGMGLDRARVLVPEALAAKRATVLDADALSAFADNPAALFEMLHEKCVLTPHGGEFAKLFPDIAAKLAEVPTTGPAYSKVDATREAAARAGCVVLYKGADTVIADPSGRCSVNAAVYERAAPWLATAGSGDVLAGFITGLLARGFAPKAAAETAAWLHVECARAFGPGLIAEDLPEVLPQIFQSLENALG